MIKHIYKTSTKHEKHSKGGALFKDFILGGQDGLVNVLGIILGVAIGTGDAKIVANIVNFVNNNISGGGKLLVTIVNVFGSWLGDFVGPGFSPDPDPVAEESDQNTGGVGGLQAEQGSSQSQSGNGSSQAVVGSTTTAGTIPFVGGVLAFNWIEDDAAGAQVAGVSITAPKTSESEKKTININNVKEIF